MLDGEIKIIESAVRGEASAFGLLYDHYQPRIYRFILIKVGRREEAEDLTHQVFLNAWQNIGNYKNLGFPFGSWLYQIARNQIIDYYRTNKVTVDLEKVEQYWSETASSETATDAKMEIERVKIAIRKLKPIHQDIVVMRFVEELSIKEVAAATKKTEGAIKLLQHRAIKHLKEILEKEGVETVSIKLIEKEAK